MSANTNNTTGKPAGFFDLHTSGLGYLNRVRMVPVKRGEAFMACTISALHGSADKPEYTTFDVRVSGGQAQEVIQMLWDDVMGKQRVLIGFKIGDIYPEAFTYEKDMGKHKKGEIGVMVKGRLLKVTFAKVNNEAVELPQAEQAPEQGTGTNG